jgi:co-chaperonin GroES (HSP10)
MEQELDLQVRGPRVLIRPEDQRMMTRASGLIAVKHDPPDVIGTVIAIGERVQDVNPGDVVLFTPDSGQVMDYGQERFLVMHEDELLAVWHEENQAV